MMNAQPKLEQDQPLRFTEPATVQGLTQLTEVTFKTIVVSERNLELVTTRIELPPEEWVRRIATACLEVVHGKRNVSQLKSITNARVSQTLTIRHSVQAKRNQAARHIAVGRIRMSQPTNNIIEASTTFSLGEKAFPLALRLESATNGWKVTACEIGPH
jgi:hypothetical protein